MKNLDNIWAFKNGHFGTSFYLEKSHRGYVRKWLNGITGNDMTIEYWLNYDATDTGFHKSEIEAYRLFLEL